MCSTRRQSAEQVADASLQNSINICNSIVASTLSTEHFADYAVVSNDDFPPQWSFGNIKGRRREVTCLNVRLCMARCRRAKRSCAYNFRDVNDCFHPSLEHNVMVQAFRKSVPWNCQQGVRRLVQPSNADTRDSAMVSDVSGELIEGRGKETAQEAISSVLRRRK